MVAGHSAVGQRKNHGNWHKDGVLNMMPEEWRNLTLSDLATVVGGGTPRKTVPDYWTGDLPWATPTDVTGLSGRFISETRSTIANAGLVSSSATLLPPYSLLLTTRATIGACAINRVPMATNQGFQNLVPKQDVEIDFLYYLVRHHGRGLERLAAGSTFLEVSKDAVRGFQVTVPPLAEQRKIAAILSSVDDAIEKTRAVIEQVQVVKQGLMEELLTRGLPGRHTGFKQTAIGEVPEEWRMITLADMAEPNSGIQTGPFGSQLHASDYVAHGVPVIMPKDLVDGYVSDVRSARISDERANDLHRHRIRAGDMLFARRGDVGRVGLITKHQDGWVCGTGCFRFRPIDPNISSFLRHWTGYSTSLEWLKEHAVGQTMLNLNTSILSRLPVALPSEEERSAINDVLEALARQIETHKRAEKGLVELKQALMLLLLTGELRVTPS